MTSIETATTTSDEVARLIAIWAQSDDIPNRSRYASHSQGGWEGWAQVEIWYFFHKNMAKGLGINSFHTDYQEPSFAILQERPVYAEDGDLFLWKLPTGFDSNVPFDAGNVSTTVPYVIIKLKCESTNNLKRFKEAVSMDVRKIANADPVNRPCIMYSIALTMNQGTGQDQSMGTEGEKAMVDLGLRAQKANLPTWEANQSNPASFRVWYWKKEFE